jgi:hypothetical protein
MPFLFSLLTFSVSGKNLARGQYLITAPVL